MARNLNYAVAGSKCGNGKGDKPSDANTSTCDTYGRLYDWVTAMDVNASSFYDLSYAPYITAKHRGICPSGWHIPFQKEWNVLMKFVNPSCPDDIYKYSSCTGAGTKLKATSGWAYREEPGNGTDTYGFAALSGGYVNSDGNGNFGADGTLGFWWSADDTVISAYRMVMSSYNENAVWEKENKRQMFSVRCLQD